MTLADRVGRRPSVFVTSASPISRTLRKRCSGSICAETPRDRSHSMESPSGRAQPGALQRILGATEEHGVDKGRVLALVIGVVVLLLIVQNSGRAELHVLIFQFDAPVWVMMLITLVLGAAGWELARRSRQRRSAATKEGDTK